MTEAGTECDAEALNRFVLDHAARQKSSSLQRFRLLSEVVETPLCRTVGRSKMTQTCRNCHREHNRPISFPFRSQTSLRCSPGGHPPNPARDVRAISLVLCAKRELQRRLFIGNDEWAEGQPEQCAEQNEARIAEQHSLTKNDCDDGDVDRIAYIPVETCDHQVLGWRNGCRCAES